MPWLRLDDRMYCNRKVNAVGVESKCLWLWGMDYSADQLTDGILRLDELQMLGAMLRLKDFEGVVRELIAVGLLHAREDGRYEIHDYLEYNPSKDVVIKEREGSKQRQAEFQKRHNATTNTSPNGVANAVSKPVPYPYPYPIKNTLARSRATKVAVSPAEGIEPITSVEFAPEAPAEVKPVEVSQDLITSRPNPHRDIFAALCREWGEPANDIERGRYNVAAKNLRQAEVKPVEVSQLRTEYLQRWPHLECSPLAVAANVTKLRQPVGRVCATRANKTMDPGKEYEPYVNPKRNT